MRLTALVFVGLGLREKKTFKGLAKCVYDREIKVSKVPEIGASLNQNTAVKLFFDGRSRGACTTLLNGPC